jgi:hypothetical protein
MWEYSASGRERKFRSKSKNAIFRHCLENFLKTLKSKSDGDECIFGYYNPFSRCLQVVRRRSVDPAIKPEAGQAKATPINNKPPAYKEQRYGIEA